jgi:hypothetical protein
MNILIVPNGREKPKDLPEITAPEEDWTHTFPAFYDARKIAMS